MHGHAASLTSGIVLRSSYINWNLEEVEEFLTIKIESMCDLIIIF